MNEQIDELEQQLLEMPKQKLYFIYVSIIVLMIFISWNLFAQEMSIEIESKENTIASLESKLKKNNMKSLERAIKKAKKDSLILEDDIVNLHFKDQFIRTKLESMDFIYFNQMGIATILDDVLKQSLKHSIDIDIIGYERVNVLEMPHIFEKEKINIDGSGTYQSIMRLLYYIDSLNALLRISAIDVSIEEGDKTSFKLEISHYGVEL